MHKIQIINYFFRYLVLYLSLIQILYISPLLSAYGATSAENLKSSLTSFGSSIDHATADRYLEEGKVDEAILLHKKLLKKNPSSGLTYYHLGYAYSLKGLYDEEIAAYQKAIQLGHKEEGLFYHLGLAYIESETNYEYAVKAFKKVLQLNPNHAEAYFNLGFSYERLGNYPKAIEALSKAIELKPIYLEAYNVLGVIYAISGQFNKAREAWTEILRHDPYNRTALFNLETLNIDELEQQTSTQPQKLAESSGKVSTEAQDKP